MARTGGPYWPFWASSHAESWRLSTDTVEVPDFTENTNISQTTVEEEVSTLGLKPTPAMTRSPTDQAHRHEAESEAAAQGGEAQSVWFSPPADRAEYPMWRTRARKRPSPFWNPPGFWAGYAKTADSGTVEKDKVVSTDPAANSQGIQRTIITLYIFVRHDRDSDNRSTVEGIRAAQ